MALYRPLLQAANQAQSVEELKTLIGVGKQEPTDKQGQTPEQAIKTRQDTYNSGSA